MNKIPSPELDDCAAIQRLADNPRVGSYPALQSDVAAIQQGYVQYEAAHGNAINIAPVRIATAVGDHLKAHYKSPPKDLEHITELRKKTEHLVCPMCGSLHSGTLDHLLPQDGYPAFAIYSLNLVPACKCNSIRQTLLRGTNSGERILHPYFDDCLSERLIKAQFRDLGPVPRVSLDLCIESTHPEYAAIDFHFRSIVKKTAVTSYLRGRLIKLCRKPSLVVRALKRNPINLNELQEVLEEELDMLDDMHQGKNNWDSIFVAGLLDDVVLAWIFHRINLPGRLPNGALIDQ